MGLGKGFVNLFKSWGKGIGNAADHVWLREEGQKAIRDEVTQKFKPKIDLANTAESKRATNIKDLDAKLKQSKQKLADDQKAWKDKYDNALADAKTQRQTDIDNYKQQLQVYKDALADAENNKQGILATLQAKEAQYNPYRTIFTDVNSGTKYVFDPSTGKYEELSTFYKKAKPKEQKAIQSYDNRLIDVNTNRVLNPFDESTRKTYTGYSAFDNYYPTKISAQDAVVLRDAESQIKKANANLQGWKKQPQSQLQAWGKKDSTRFEQDFKKNNGESPTGYSFNGQNYSDETALDTAYQKALNHAQYKRDYFRTKASNYASERDKEIAQRIQDAKDMNKAKVALGLGTAGALAGATYAAFSGDDTDNTNNINNGEPDPNFNIKNTPEVQAQLNDEQQPDTAPINTGFDPDKADALAAAAYDKGVEDSNSIESSGDLGNNIAANTGGHTIDDGLSADDIHTNEGIGTRRSMNEGLFSVIKALQDPHQANAVADYIYSRYGNDPELQQLGWRAWLNKYYGDALRSQMNLDASGYNGMHIA